MFFRLKAWVNFWDNIEFSVNKIKQIYASSIQQYTLKLNSVENASKVQAANHEYKRVQSIDQMNATSRSYFYDENSKTLYVNIPVNERQDVNIRQ